MKDKLSVLPIKRTQRLTRAEKNANDKAWYKQQADMLDIEHNSYMHNRHASYVGEAEEVGNGKSRYRSMKSNYDLFNNIINMEDFKHVVDPYGTSLGNLPAKMENRDISSGKIKAVLGMESKRAFNIKILTTNPEATTQREKEHFSRIKEFVTSSIMTPIRQQLEQQSQEESKGKKLTEQEVRQIQQEIEQELQALTPEEVKKYMARDYQNPSEMLYTQLLNYLKEKLKLKDMYNRGYKHGLLGGGEIYFVGNLNNQPVTFECNPLDFTPDLSTMSEYVEDGEKAAMRYNWLPSEVIKFFGDVLTDKEIDEIYESTAASHRAINMEEFGVLENDYDLRNNENTVDVTHAVWKSLRKFVFLTYRDEEGNIQEKIVDESYKLDLSIGDIELTYEWILEAYETWKIGRDIYKHMRPIQGQHRDLDNLYECKLPYYGAYYDATNSEFTSLFSRMKTYQYLYNVIMYKIELLIGSDKGKKVLMNIGSIPDNSGIDIEKFQYFFESSPFMWTDTSQEGSGYNDVNTVAKVVDLSLVSDIQKYIQLAEYIKSECGKSVGITENVEGQVQAREAVSNVQQNLQASSNILEPYFQLHDNIKRNVTEAVLNCARVAYTIRKPQKLSYILDDMSISILEMDTELLEMSTLGIFLSDSTKIEEIKQTINQLGHAALQNQQIELSDMLSLLKQDSIIEAEETLKVAEIEKREQAAKLQQQEAEAAKQAAEAARDFQREEWEHEKELVILKEREKRETELQKAALMAASFNPDQDKDGDGQNDFIEIAKYGLDADIQERKQSLDEQKFAHQEVIDKEKIQVEKMKINSKPKK